MSKNEKQFDFLPNSDNFRDSLRFSNDPQFLKDEDFDVSTDGLQLTFNFQDDNSSKLKEKDNVKEESKQKRKQIFSKFKKKISQKVIEEDNGILKTFDSVFLTENNENTHSQKPSLRKLCKSSLQSKQQRITDVSLTFQNSKIQLIETENSIEQNKEGQVTFEEFVKELNEQDRLSLKTEKSNSEVQSVYEYNKEQQKEQKNYLDHPINEQQHRIPPFLRKARKANSIYPNFDHPKFKKQNQRGKIRQICIVFEEALDELTLFTKKIDEKTKGTVEFNINFHEAFTLDYFLNSKWEKSRDIPNLQRIRPTINYPRRSINFANIYKAFTSYRTIIQYYKNYAELDLPQEKTKYLEIRNKFWSVQRNLNSISQDIYSLALNFEFPYHYHEFLYVLRTQIPKLKRQPQSTYWGFLNKVIHLQNKRQRLSCSEVGKAVREKLQRSLMQ